MGRRPVVTLTTDFGSASPYVAQMKGVLLARCPDVQLVDITHAIRPQDVRHAAVVLDQATRHFPPDSCHLVVVDPGVGTARHCVYVRLGDQHFVGPDNGLFSLRTGNSEPDQVVILENRQFWRPQVSRTFHGRDIMAPVAAAIVQGVPPEQLGPSGGPLVRLDWPTVEQDGDFWYGQVLDIDSFGNIITNLQEAQLAVFPPSNLVVQLKNTRVDGLVATYGERPEGSLVALFGSSGLLELAEVNGNAAARTGAQVGDRVTVACR